jgi:hypothetical protein
MLQNFIENGVGDAKLKKGGKGGSHEVELMVGTVYNEVLQLLEEHQVQMSMPE